MRLFFFLTAILISFLSHVRGDAVKSPPEKYDLPWLTGPLIAPQPVVIPLRHFQLQYYTYATVNTGTYNSHWRAKSNPNFYSVNPELVIYVGLTEFMDISFTPQAFYNATQGQSSFQFGDLPTGLDFQLVDSQKYQWFPGIKFAIEEIFPTGKYQKLNPKKKGTDVGGEGAFRTDPSLVFYKIYHIKGQHYLSVELDLEYLISTSVHVREFNAYGGGFGTKGTVFPGNFFTGILSFEYSFNKNWVIALDNVFYHQDKTRFRGKKGALSPTSDESPAAELNLSTLDAGGASIGGPSSEQYSLAVGIEYNFNKFLGISGGTWFSVAGRNSKQFASAALTLYYYY
jgi:hypothetical protein